MTNYQFIKRAQIVKDIRCLSFTVHLGPNKQWYANAYDDTHGPNNPVLYNGYSLAWAKDSTPWDAIESLLKNKEFKPYDD